MMRIDTDAAESEFGIGHPQGYGDELTDYDQVVYGGSESILISHRLDRVVDIDTDGRAPADYSVNGYAEV